jgi:hypothetical protein
MEEKKYHRYSVIITYRPDHKRPYTIELEKGLRDSEVIDIVWKELQSEQVPFQYVEMDYSKFRKPTNRWW